MEGADGVSIGSRTSTTSLLNLVDTSANRHSNQHIGHVLCLSVCLSVCHTSMSDRKNDQTANVSSRRVAR